METVTVEYSSDREMYIQNAMSAWERYSLAKKLEGCFVRAVIQNKFIWMGIVNSAEWTGGTVVLLKGKFIRTDGDATSDNISPIVGNVKVISRELSE